MLNIQMVYTLRILTRIAAMCFCLCVMMGTLARGQNANSIETQPPAQKYFTDEY
jgi:fumarate reductase subunit C